MLVCSEAQMATAGVSIKCSAAWYQSTNACFTDVRLVTASTCQFGNACRCRRTGSADLEIVWGAVAPHEKIAIRRLRRSVHGDTSEFRGRVVVQYCSSTSADILRMQRSGEVLPNSHSPAVGWWWCVCNSVCVAADRARTMGAGAQYRLR